MDFKGRRTCSLVCHRWNVLIGTAKDFRHERNLTLKHDFDPAVFRQSQTGFHSLTIHDFDTEQDMGTVWERWGCTVKELDFHTTEWKIVNMVTENDNFPNVKKIRFSYGLVSNGYIKLSDLPTFERLETLEIDTKKLNDSNEELRRYFCRQKQLQKLHLTLEEFGNTEDCFKTVCESLPALKDFQFYTINWENGISFDTVLKWLPQHIESIKLLNMVKFYAPIETSIVKLFTKYLYLKFVKITHTHATFQPEKKGILIETNAPQKLVRLVPFKGQRAL